MSKKELESELAEAQRMLTLAAQDTRRMDWLEKLDPLVVESGHGPLTEIWPAKKLYVVGSLRSAVDRELVHETTTGEKLEAPICGWPGH